LVSLNLCGLFGGGTFIVTSYYNRFMVSIPYSQ